MNISTVSTVTPERSMSWDERERTGSFFTPKIWVELSQKYIADVLGESWQDEYYVWDCAAGTGNLLTGLTNKYRIWASTLDKQDVDIMKDSIAHGANMLASHVFQFDFLNDDFTKLPKHLQDIINDENKRKKLVIYINPPYADSNTIHTKDTNRIGNNLTKTREKYKPLIGASVRELYTQFLIRIYYEIPCARIANFSTLKILTGSNYSGFRKIFQANIESLFLVPADTFYNVNGQFPVGFFIWNTAIKGIFRQITADVYDKDGAFLQNKNIYSCDYAAKGKINDWFRPFWKNAADLISTDDRSANARSADARPKNIVMGYINAHGTDFQHSSYVWISRTPEENTAKPIVIANLIASCIYLAVRKVIPATWLNHNDQFLYPNDGWERDREFQNNCLAYTLFNNNIQSKYGKNHWIPFAPKEVNAPCSFESSFMVDFMNGKLVQSGCNDLFEQAETKCIKRTFSPEAKAVFSAGKKLWRHYFQTAAGSANVNAGFYDIKEFFQGRNEKTGRMNNKSDNAEYNLLIANLRDALKTLAQKIELKVYAYGFLKK